MRSKWSCMSRPATWADYALGFGLVMFVLGFAAGFLVGVKVLVPMFLQEFN